VALTKDMPKEYKRTTTGLARTKRDRVSARRAVGSRARCPALRPAAASCAPPRHDARAARRVAACARPSCGLWRPDLGAQTAEKRALLGHLGARSGTRPLSYFDFQFRIKFRFATRSAGPERRAPRARVGGRGGGLGAGQALPA
jgi:hypothetical protein